MTETQTSGDKYDPSAKLHRPARKDQLDSFENHIHDTARLSRALWAALGNEDSLVDERTQHALLALASVVADHASAVEYLF